MAAPRGATYTPTRGPLAGQTFRAPPGRTAPTAAYNAYQNALAQYRSGGQYTTYAQQRVAEDRGLIANITNFLTARGTSRTEARETAREFYQQEAYHGPTRPAGGPSGRNPNPGGALAQRKRHLMAWLYDEGYLVSDQDHDDAWDYLDY
jgi:hypothetical protein